MPSFAARMTGLLLRYSTPLQWFIWGGDLQKKNFRRVRRWLCTSPGPKLRRKLEVSSEDFRGRTVWHIGPGDRQSNMRMLYWHGGGFVLGPMSMHWKFMERLASDFGLSFIVPEYPLAPEADAVEISDFAVDYYRHLIAQFGAGNLVMAGDSAGGTLTAVTALLARQAGLPLPNGLVMISPALDGAPSDHPDYAKIRRRDTMLGEKTVAGLRQLYVRDLPLTDIRVRPIDGDYTGFPPILMFAGTDDVLVIGSRELKQKVPTIDYVEGRGLFHVWPLFSLPESRDARARIASFVSGVTAADRNLP